MEIQDSWCPEAVSVDTNILQEKILCGLLLVKLHIAVSIHSFVNYSTNRTYRSGECLYTSNLGYHADSGRPCQRCVFT